MSQKTNLLEKGLPKPATSRTLSGLEKFHSFMEDKKGNGKTHQEALAEWRKSKGLDPNQSKAKSKTIPKKPVQVETQEESSEEELPLVGKKPLKKVTKYY